MPNSLGAGGSLGGVTAAEATTPVPVSMARDDDAFAAFDQAQRRARDWSGITDMRVEATSAG